MKLLDLLLGWTGYEPLGFFLSGVNIILNATFCLLLQYIPLRRFLRVRPRAAVLLNAGLVVLCMTSYLRFPAFLADAGTGQVIVSAALYFPLFMPLAFYLLNGCALQNLFVIPYALCATLFVMGTGNWLEFRFGDALLPGINSVVAFFARLILFPIFLPLGIRSLKKLFTAWSGNEAAAFWKAVWLIPVALFTLTMLSGNVLTLTEANHLPFLLTRVLSVAALLNCVAMMTDIMNREQEMAAARMREEMMDMAGKARDKSYAETLTAWEQTDSARKEARAVVERVMACAQTGGHDEISGLLRDRMAGLEAEGAGRLCENEAVNALAVHYAAVARKEGIEVSYKLDIPKQAGRVQNVDLSRIIGNMLENAIEACRRMDYGAKNIRLQSMLMGDMLVLGMSNSFDGDFTLTDGRYVSRKRESGVATGLNSIQSVADKYNGAAKFEADGRVFKTSVRLDMAGAE